MQVFASQTLPHMPQLLLSSIKSAQTCDEPDAGHNVRSGEHWQAPATHAPSAHALKQPPQFCGSLWVSVHCPLQEIIGTPQVLTSPSAAILLCTQHGVPDLAMLGAGQASRSKTMIAALRRLSKRCFPAEGAQRLRATQQSRVSPVNPPRPITMGKRVIQVILRKIGFCCKLAVSRRKHTKRMADIISACQ
jgi:hypothetical protein